MFTFGIVVEGVFDEEIIPALVEKIFSQDHRCLRRVAGNKIGVLNRFLGFLEEFRYRNDVDKALVILDSDGEPVDQIIDKMARKVEGRDYPFPVKFCVVKEEIESWLLADESAISNVVNKNIPRVKEDLENMPSPKERLRQILSQTKTVYTKEIARRIAVEASLNIIESRCSIFRDFKKSIIDC